jgi:hypothetical protein
VNSKPAFDARVAILPGNANLLIGGWHDANQEIGAPGYSPSAFFINTLLKIGYAFHGRIRALWRNRPCLNHCRNTKKRN